MESEEEEIDTTNVCFMANGGKSPTVIIKPSLDDDELTKDEHAQFFEKLQNRSELSILQNKK